MAVWRNYTIAQMLCLSTLTLCSHRHELCKSVMERVSDVDMTRPIMPGFANKRFYFSPSVGQAWLQETSVFYFYIGKLFKDKTVL